MWDLIVLFPPNSESLTTSKLTNFSVFQKNTWKIQRQHIVKQIIVIYNADILPQKDHMKIFLQNFLISSNRILDKLYVFFGCPKSLRFTVYCCMPGKRMWTHASFCQELIVLPGICVEVSTPTSTYRQFITWMFYLSKCHSKQDLSSNIIYPAILFTMLIRIFKLW